MLWFNDNDITDECSGRFWDQQIVLDFVGEHTDLDVVVVAGRYWYNKIDQINQRISRLDSVLVIVTGDEEGLFPVDELDHPNMRVWLQSPHIRSYEKVDRYIPIGYPPNTKEILSEIKDKHLRWMFAGQNTHQRRKECVEQLRDLDAGLLVESEGFTQGLGQHEYLANMGSAKTVPCPSGAVIPDTFRLYEALEAGAVPLVDAYDATGGSEGYWRFLFGEYPFPLIHSWGEVGDNINFFNDTYPVRQNECFGWWQQYKRQLKKWFQHDLIQLGQLASKKDVVTVLIPTSPSYIHPSTEHIETTIDSIRHYLPHVEILIMIDGVREEQSKFYGQYQEYVRRLLWKCNFEYENVTPILFKEHSHQAEMARQTLKLVDTTLIMFVEHDTPIVIDEPIDFDAITKFVSEGHADIVRLHHESHILPEHQHLNIGDIETYYGAEFQRTAQWSQRPHIASTEYYRRIIQDYFPSDCKTMIEDRIHGITQQGWLERASAGWQEHRIWLYVPDENMKRSYHLDGRGSEPKYEMQF